MQAHGTPPRPLPGPAATPEPALRFAPGDVRPYDARFLDEMRVRSLRQAEAIRARSEWIEARVRDLWARMDRLRDETRARASSPGAVASLVAPLAADGAGAPGAAAPLMAPPGRDDVRSAGAVPWFVPVVPPPGRTAAILDDLAHRVDALLGMVRGAGPEVGRDPAPRPEPLVEAGAAG